MLLAVGALLSACSNDEPDEGGTRVPRATTTSTTSAAERYAIPDTITPEYVNDVLAALNHVYGDVVRKHISTGELSPQDLVPLRAIYYEAEFQEQGAAIGRSPRLPDEKYASPIGDRRISVDRLLTTRPECVAAEVTYDFSPLLVEAPPPGRGWLSLRPKEAGTDPDGRNPTPWAIASESLSEEDKCAS